MRQHRWRMGAQTKPKCRGRARHGACYAPCVMSAGSRRSLLVAAIALCAIAFAQACNSPTLPLPPPAPPAVHSVLLLNGHVVIQGNDYAVEPRARVWCVNQINKSSADAVADSRGAFLLSLPAEAGNTVACWQQVDHLVSDAVTIVVPQPSR